MKILIAVDERSSSDKLYYDLKRAGLPMETVEVYVLSVADVFIVPGYTKKKFRRSRDKAYLNVIDHEINKAQKIAEDMTRKLKTRFSGWLFHPESSGGSVAQEIFNKAKEWKIDLVVIGSHGRVGVGELFFGSVAQKVLSESPCSVRIVRKCEEEINSPSRIIIGVDASSQSDAMIEELIKRNWKNGSAVHLITAIDAGVYTALIPYGSILNPQLASVLIPYYGPASRKEWEVKEGEGSAFYIEKTHTEYKSRLEAAGLIVTSLIKEGDPKIIITREVKRWGAECIFVGAV